MTFVDSVSRVTILAMLIVSVAFADASQAGTQSDPQRICAQPSNAVVRSSPPTANGYRAAEGWLASDRGQAMSARVNAMVASIGGAVLGESADYNSQKIIVVLDPGSASSELSAAEATLGGSADAASISIRMGCHGASALSNVAGRLTSGAYRSGNDATYAVSIEPTTGTVQVITDSDVFARRVTAEFGDLVQVAVSPNLGRQSRNSDASPHYGGARLNGVCSSNFTFTSNVYGIRVMATAGHCFASGAVVNSGTNLVGSVIFRSFPDPDAEMIYAAGQTYTNKLYTDPGAPTVRSVIGKVNPGVNASVCSDGSFTLAKCGATVINTNSQFCDASGCTNNLTQTFNFDAFCQPGDSGGPWYQRSGSTGALAAGLTIAGGPAFGGTTCWFHKISTVESILQSTLLTSP